MRPITDIGSIEKADGTPTDSVATFTTITV